MDSPEWYTPSPIVEAAREVMGGIDLDPASDAEANRIVGASRFFTAQEDGLQHVWSGCTLLNAPGGLVNEFWLSLMRWFHRGAVTQAIWIGYSLEQLQTLQVYLPEQLEILRSFGAWTPLHFSMCVPKRRIAFEENEARRTQRTARIIAKGEAPGASVKARKDAARCRAGKPPRNAPSHGNYITYIGPRVEAFVRVFSQFGEVMVPKEAA